MTQQATFEALQFKWRDHKIGKQARVTFPNGYGASVIIGPYTYGGEDGLYELAVIGPNGLIDYSTPVTDDVLGCLSPDDVTAALKQIAALPRTEKGESDAE